MSNCKSSKEKRGTHFSRHVYHLPETPPPKAQSSIISTLFSKTERRSKLKGMAKKMVDVSGGGGIGKKRLIKRSKKKSIHKVIHYLLSDCYLYAPILISPSPINSHAAPTRGFFHFSFPAPFY